MQVLIYSDVHDNVLNLQRVFSKAKNLGVKKALALGDFGSPNAIRAIIENGLPTKAVFGNTDGEKVMSFKLASESNGILSITPKTSDIIEMSNKKVYIDHFPDIAPTLAVSGEFDAVFYGHTHEIEYEKLENGCILANPGEVGGYITGKSTFLVWNTKLDEIKEYELNI
ncbi:YfcE family phosphodiesterase [Candidatus Dojkabacteria bacterium]|nr:YfcE family phosphodiesterase [Candidatus Dojkabacteria bacterium]